MQVVSLLKVAQVGMCRTAIIKRSFPQELRPLKPKCRIKDKVQLTAPLYTQTILCVVCYDGVCVVCLLTVARYIKHKAESRKQTPLGMFSGIVGCMRP